ncbi:MAG TPA: metallophosphoesterase [Tepidisphaeraceae bacterium]|nr:metallophosphoesterase [Tepidisphaeraceae bacterium]
MPITLPPISRRRFLKGAVAATGAVALGSRFSFGANATPADPNRLALLSDTHISPDKNYLHKTGIKVWDQYQQVTREVLALEQRPAALLVNGDCALDHGTAAAYATFTEGLDPIRTAGVPVHLGLGNHDARADFANAFPTDDVRVKEITDHTVSIVRLPTVDWYILDSLVKTKYTPGALGPAQLAWLAKSLDANPDRPSVLMMHHQPDTRAEKANGLTDTQALLEIVHPRKQVKAVLFGHTHIWTHYEQEGIHFVNLPTTAYVFDPKQPAGWVDAQLSQKGMKLELHAIAPNHPQDKQTLDLPWRA